MPHSDYHYHLVLKLIVCMIQHNYVRSREQTVLTFNSFPDILSAWTQLATTHFVRTLFIITKTFSLPRGETATQLL